MLIRLDDQGPLYLQIYRALRKGILNRELAPSSRLPASRRMATELGVSRNVVLLAYDQLRAEGYLEGKVGAGTFVASQLPAVTQSIGSEEDAAPDSAAVTVPPLSSYGQRALALHRELATQASMPPRYDFRFGEIAVDQHSVGVWRRLLNRHVDRVQRSSVEVAGYPPLREAIVDYVYRNRGISCSADQIIVVNGTQQALDLIARVFVDPGVRVLLEEPHYAGTREVFLAAGAELVLGRVDHEGLDIRSLTEQSARLACITPSHQFPTGAVMPFARRQALLAWAQRHDAYVVEDDYDSEYRYEGRPLEAVQALDRGGRTLYIGTFSKHLFPTLRLGFLILPPVLVAPFITVKYLADRYTAMLNQAVLADFIAEGHFDRHLRRMRNANETRRQAVLAALTDWLGARVTISGSNAGVHLVIWLPRVTPSLVATIVQEALAVDVGVYSINSLFYHPPDRAGLLLGYESLSAADIKEGVKRLAGVLLRYV